jgi:Zn-dependent protease with chaperone function
VHASGLLAAFLGRHLLPALFSSVLLLIALELLFSVGRLRRPAYRVLFLYAVLLKCLVAVLVGEGVSCLPVQPTPKVAGYVAVSIPGLFAGDRGPWELPLIAAVVHSSELSLRVLLAVVVFLAGFLCYRWLRLAPFFRGFRAGEFVEAARFPGLHETFQDLVDRAWGSTRWPRRPRLLVLRDESCCAFTMGIRPPVVVVSADLARQLSGPELRGILAHEVAHVRRMDYLGRWIATILRDLLMWNPFVHRWHRRLLVEQEKASDERAAALLDDPAAVASGLVELAAYAGKVPLTSVGPLPAWAPGAKARLLEVRLSHLEWVSLHAEPNARRRALALVLLAAFVLAQPHVVLPVNRFAVPFREVLGAASRLREMSAWHPRRVTIAPLPRYPTLR